MWSWSYDNVTTYPIMPMPTKEEKRLEKKNINGKEILVSVEVEVHPHQKHQFLFPGKELR